MPEPSLNGSSREQLQQALLAAYPSEASLAPMLRNKMEVNLDAVVQPGSLGDRIFRLITWAESQGRIEDLLRAAVAGNPGNQRLENMSQRLLQGTIRGAHEYLTTDAFDLRTQESSLVRAFASPGKRLLVFVLRDADAYVRDSVIRRLERRLTDTLAPRKQTVTLRPTISNMPEAIARVGGLKKVLVDRHALCIVLADGVQAEVVERFFQGVRESLSGALSRYMVILASLTEGCAAPEDCVEIPPPVIDELDLHEWVQRVTEGKGWPPDLVDEFAAAVLQEARYENTLSVGRVYDVLTRVIELLSTNPDAESLRERFRTGF